MDAPAIVLVHGSVVSRKIWLPQLRSLSNDHRVVAPDLPGHGDLAALPFTFAAAVETVRSAIVRTPADELWSSVSRSAAGSRSRSRTAIPS